MRTRKLALALAIIVATLTALLVTLGRRPSAKPIVTIGVLGYDRHGSSVTAQIGITNAGQKAIQFNYVSFAGHSWVRIEKRNGQVTRFDQSPLPSSMCAVPLQPGSYTCVSIEMTSDVVRWQIAYPVRMVSSERSVLARMPAKWRPQLYRVFKNWLSEEPEQEVASAVFEGPSSMFDFDPLAPPPAALGGKP